MNSSATLPATEPRVPIAKLMPPRGTRKLIARTSLEARLIDARRARCVLVHGPAGSGKTTTLLQWRKALMRYDFDVAWLSLGPEDNTPTRFFDCLLASLAEIDATIVREAALLMGHDNNNLAAAELWIITLVQAITARDRELVLVLDDIHLIDDRRITRALQWLLDYAPPQLHLAFGSRRPFAFPLGRLEAHNMVATFDLNDLRFTAAESAQFLREQLGTLEARDAQTLHELADGWIAGLQLFVIDLKAKQGGGSYARVQLRDAQAFASYFEREVLAHLSPDDLDLLTRVAVASRFCASLVAHLAQRPWSVAEKASWLHRMDDEDLFIAQIPSHDRETWYRLHPLLREVLLARLSTWPENRRHALHAAAWKWFSEHGYIDEAVQHAVQANDPAAAADMVEACGEDLMARGSLSQLAGLLRHLPDTLIQSAGAEFDTGRIAAMRRPQGFGARDDS